MSGAESFVPTPLMLSDAARARLRTLIEEEGNPALKLRVYVTGGGCSGFQYGFDFADEVGEDDAVIEFGDVAMVVDALSYQYLVGSTVDFEEGLAGTRFLVQNPNATTTCGCGASFMV
ncbi:iron-sulfur cluster insertion protein ErpA [Halomonas faecis]|uniref:iron-sulfur cluster insertion protein ErpA n=1 Tax=Halomonas faecis TaxID=1562110 RepID=UPI0013D58CA5|nr:iron-sulfur cluster insertion protein ErpA [Halomonas faecis]